jgi:hypothetical protein
MDVLESVEGAVSCRPWSNRTVSGETIVDGGDSGSFEPPRRPYDYIMAVFPPEQLLRMVRFTMRSS